MFISRVVGQPGGADFVSTERPAAPLAAVVVQIKQTSPPAFRSQRLRMSACNALFRSRFIDPFVREKYGREEGDKAFADDQYSLLRHDTLA